MAAAKARRRDDINPNCKLALQIIGGVLGLMSPFMLVVVVGLFAQAQQVARMEVRQTNMETAFADYRSETRAQFNQLRIDNRADTINLADKIDKVLLGQIIKP